MTGKGERRPWTNWKEYSKATSSVHGFRHAAAFAVEVEELEEEGLQRGSLEPNAGSVIHDLFRLRGFPIEVLRLKK